MILFIDACVRKDSRTRRLAKRVLSHLSDPVETVRLEEIGFPKTDEAFLRKRDACIAADDFRDPMFDLAKQFQRADTVVVAAPHWDLSFPAALKQYFEQINILGVTFQYTPQGEPQGLCRAKQLFYLTTAGGCFVPEEYGFGYVKALARSFYGIPEVQLFQAAGLDIEGADPERLLARTMEQIRAAFLREPDRL